MSYSNISDMILEMNKDGNQQKSALALSNTSELEIKNLLKQVDSMIHHKKLRWERQKQDLDNKLIAREQENQAQKMTLEQKNIEISQLRKLIDNMETTTQEIMKKYEKEINNLNQQLNKIKLDYIKVQKKYKKNNKKDGEDEPTSGSSSSDKNQAKPSNSISNISNDIFQIDSSTSGSASSTLIPASSNNQMHNFKPPKIVINKGNPEQVSPSKYENEIKQLKDQVELYKQREIDYYNEKDKIAKVLDHYKKINQDLIQKVEDLARLNGLSGENSNEAQTDKLNIDYYRSEIRKRDEYIRNLEALDKADNIELQFFKDEVKKYKKQETSFKNEISKMKKDYEDTRKRLTELDNENKKIQKNIHQVEESYKAKIDEMLRQKYEKERENQLKEIKKLKEELVLSSNQLKEKNFQINSLTERYNCLEKLLKEKDEQLTKSNQELLMTTAHIEALRLENQFLRQSLMERKSDERDVVEMQKKYHTVLDLTEKENRKLKNEIISLSECVESLKSKQNHLMSLAKSANTNTNINVDLLENRRSKILRDEYEQQIETLKRQHELSVKRLNNEIEKLYGEKHALQVELDSRSKATFSNQLKTNRSNLSSSNADSNSISCGVLSVSNNQGQSNHPNDNSNGAKKLKQFNGIDTINNFRFDESTNNLLKRLNLNNEYLKPLSTNRFNLNNDNENLDTSPFKSNQRRLSMNSQLQNEDEIRKKTLDNLLETHIEELRRSSGNEHIVDFNKL